MRVGFYFKLAWQGIKKNRRCYLPYLLSSMVMLSLYYIITMLSKNPMLRSTPGGGALFQILSLGKLVIAFFSLLFLFYTHSFLIRRRKKEFGLYNVLGMGKKGLSKVLFWEIVQNAVITGIGGFSLGILFSKLAELALLKVTGTKLNYAFFVSKDAITEGSIFFGIIFFLLFLNSLRQIRLSKPVEMLNSERAGEKPPKANWILGVAGVVILGAAYFLAVSIQNPLDVLLWFFVAVIMVIVATYLLFIAGSVVLCKLLQKKKSYYYQPKHFVSLSSMIFRMKRNGAGLASICILATMVLVMLSGTTALYRGLEDGLLMRYPRQIALKIDMSNKGRIDDKMIQDVNKMVEESVKEEGAKLSNVLKTKQFTYVARREGTKFPIDGNRTYTETTNIRVMDVNDYENIHHKKVDLSKDEALIYPVRTAFKKDSITLGNQVTFHVKQVVEDMEIDGAVAMDIAPTIYVIVSDFSSRVNQLIGMAPKVDYPTYYCTYHYAFDVSADKKVQKKVGDTLEKALNQWMTKNPVSARYLETRAMEEDGFRGLYGGLFFIGILLSIGFLMATVLIIYYKQISEGYEDQNRFSIMKKVGMTNKEIKKSINSQILLVFFLPLIGAGMHLGFAFPMIRKLLLLFNIFNTKAVVMYTVESFAVFAVFYCIVYKITSNAYYQIVSE